MWIHQGLKSRTKLEFQSWYAWDVLPVLRISVRSVPKQQIKRRDGWKRGGRHIECLLCAPKEEEDTIKGGQLGGCLGQQ